MEKIVEALEKKSRLHCLLHSTFCSTSTGFQR
jgi:hypothetical protein